MRLAFITNHGRTYSYYRIAERLEAKGHSIFWIASNRYWLEWLTERGVAAERILTLNNYADEWTAERPLTEGEIAHLRRLEQVGGRSMVNLILSDRHLRRRPEAYAMRYLASIARHLDRFIGEQGVDAVMGEATWSLEILTAFICLDRNIAWRVFHTIRMPADRQAFFTHIDNDQLLEWRQPTAEEKQEAAEWYADFRARTPQPFYMHVAGWTPEFRWRWVGRFFWHLRLLHLSRHDEMMLTLPRLMRNRLGNWGKEWLNKLLHKRLFESAAPYLDKPYVLVTLHVQPEATVDVLGGYVNDQVAMLRALAQNMPAGMPLLVKAHKNALGQNGPLYYHSIRSIPGVRLIDAAEPVQPLMRGAACVLSISGTSCFEAALLGIPAGCVAPLFFEELLALPRLNPYSDQLKNFLKQREHFQPASTEACIDLLARLRACSFESYLTLPLFAPEMEGETNQQRLAEAFDHMLGLLEEKQKAAA